MLSEDYSQDPIICVCASVPRSEILDCIRAQKARTCSASFERIQSDTLASTSCGSCEPEVREILAQQLAEPV